MIKIEFDPSNGNKITGFFTQFTDASPQPESDNFIEVSQEEYNTAMAANANVVKDGVAVYEAPVISAEAQAAVDAYVQAGISGNQKLLDLGLTQEEATALTGYVPPSE